MFFIYCCSHHNLRRTILTVLAVFTILAIVTVIAGLAVVHLVQDGSQIGQLLLAS